MIGDKTTRARRLLKIGQPQNGPGMSRSLVVARTFTPEHISSALRNEPRICCLDSKLIEKPLADRRVQQTFSNDQSEMGHQIGVASNKDNCAALVSGNTASEAGMPALISLDTSFKDAPSTTSEPSLVGCTRSTSSAAMPGSMSRSTLCVERITCRPFPVRCAR